MKIATSSYPIERLVSWEAFEAKLTSWAGQAARHGAELLVFPEYAAMELAAWSGATRLEAQMHAAAALLPAMWDHLAGLAARFDVHILAPSGPFRDREKWVNRTMMIAPNGARHACDKQIMTPWERAPMGVERGAPLDVMETKIGRIGVLICYDCEFPLLARALVEAGAQVLLVPSATETLAGYWRVRTGAMARALEGQCAVVQSPTVGSASWCEVLDENIGCAGVYTPMDLGFPDDGVLSIGQLNRPGWTYADVDFAALEGLQARGNVRTRAHWHEQPGAGQKVLANLAQVSLL
ncbi:MAG: carbon-nitrogen hydrolase family protein [Maritimibacter sp.]